MNTKRIVTVNNIPSLLMEGVRDLLGWQGTSFEILSIFATDHASLIVQVEQLQPNVIIMEEIAAFGVPANLIASLLHVANIRLIVVNSRASNIDIYDKSQLAISKLDDFFEALRDESCSLYSFMRKVDLL